MTAGILSGIVLTLVTVALEFDVTIVRYSGPWCTFTVVMFQALESGGGIAAAAASILSVVTLVPILRLHQLVRRCERG